MEKATKYLSENNRSQVEEYLKFFRSKRQKAVDDLQHQFDDQPLLEDMYSQSEVKEIVQALGKIIKADVFKGLENFTYSSVLVINQLFMQAESQNANLSMDLSKLDDESLLKEVKQFEEDKKFMEMPESLTKRKLDSIATKPVDLNLVAKSKDLEEELKQLKKKLEDEEKAHQETKKRLQMTEHTLKMMQSGKAGPAQKPAPQPVQKTDSGSDEMVQKLMKELADLKVQYQETQKSLTEKVSQTKQFQELMKMVQKKNEMIKTLRAKVAASEPSAGGDAKQQSDEKEDEVVVVE